MNKVVYTYRVWVAEFPEFKATYRLKKGITEGILRAILKIPDNVHVEPRLDFRLKNGGREIL